MRASETGRLRFAPDGLRVLRGNPLRTPLAKQGPVRGQDEASQLVALMCGRQQRWRTLDACAAPGGARRSCSPPGPARERPPGRGGPPLAAVEAAARLPGHRRRRSGEDRRTRSFGRRPIQGHLRSRARGRPVHRPGRHAAARGRHPVAPLGAAMSERRRRSGADAAPCGEAWWPQAAGWSMPPVPASRRRTRVCSRHGSAANRASARPARSCCRAKASRPGCSTSRAICTPARIYTGLEALFRRGGRPRQCPLTAPV